MQWDTTMNAGFSNGKPWLPVNANYTTINAAAQESDENSVLNYFRKMIKLRKENKDVLVYGKYSLLFPSDSKLFAYTREANGKKILVLLNFSKEESPVDLSLYKLGDVWINNLSSFDTNKSGVVNLKPYQAVIVELK